MVVYNQSSKKYASKIIGKYNFSRGPAVSDKNCTDNILRNSDFCKKYIGANLNLIFILI